MHVVRALNVNDAWPQLIELVKREGRWQETRAGRALVVPVPVATVYARPTERVLFDPVRDANPFFSLFEPLWMLAGRDDADWLDVFVSDFSARFAEDGGRMHGAYGKRWRDWFLGNPGKRETRVDQLDEVVRLLRANPQDRQAVIQMWDPTLDLGVPGLKDRPCNQQVLLRADRGEREIVNLDHLSAAEQEKLRGIPTRFLDITVTNRSNDLSWGLITANACQFSTLHEYLAARMGYEVGTYTQFSNNLHVYEAALEKVDYASAAAWTQDARFPTKYPGTARLVTDPETFDEELRLFLTNPEVDRQGFRNDYFHDVAQPVWLANKFRREKALPYALAKANIIAAPDWREATVAWIRRRMK